MECVVREPGVKETWLGRVRGVKTWPRPLGDWEELQGQKESGERRGR